MSQADHARFEVEPPRRGWFARNWLWFVPTVIIIPLLLCGGCIGGLLYIGLGAVKDTDVYKGALKRVQDSPDVQAKLGQPIEDSTALPSSEFHFDNGTQTSTVRFSVKGPSGSADVEAGAVLVGDKWHYERLIVTNSDGTTIDVSDAPVALEGDAPVFGDDAPAAEEAAPPEEKTPKGPPPPLNIDIEDDSKDE